jgi:transcriptional regulator with XRE-family HTH domain
MTSKSDFGIALREIRTRKHIPQESLGASQSFISAVERGLRSPTLQKLEQLAATLNVNPITILAYSQLANGQSPEALFASVREELRDLGK